MNGTTPIWLAQGHPWDTAMVQGGKQSVDDVVEVRGRMGNQMKTESDASSLAAQVGTPETPQRRDPSPAPIAFW